MTQQLFWYTSRASGIVGWALLTFSVMWGLMISGRIRPGGTSRAWLTKVHQHLSAVACAFTAVHVIAIVADSYADFGLTEVFVPLTSSWRPAAVAWGVVAMYLLIAVQLTSWIRNRLPKALWKAIHFTSLPLWLFSTIHMMTAGTSGSNRVLVAAAWASGLAIVVMTIVRIISGRHTTPPPVRPSRPSAAAGRVPVSAPRSAHAVAAPMAPRSQYHVPAPGGLPLSPPTAAPPRPPTARSLQ